VRGTWKQSALTGFSSSSRPFRNIGPAPLGVALEVPRCSLTNVGLERFPSKTLLCEALRFRAPPTRRQATTLVSQRLTSASPRHCSKRTQEVKHGRRSNGSALFVLKVRMRFVTARTEMTYATLARIEAARECTYNHWVLLCLLPCVSRLNACTQEFAQDGSSPR